MDGYPFINTMGSNTHPISFDPACLSDPTMDYHFGHNYPMGASSTDPSRDLYNSVFPPSPMSPCDTVESSGDESKKQPTPPRQTRSGGKPRPRHKRSSDSQERISHKQVERKYRDRVKAGMELLERTCVEPEKEDKNGVPRRPSKIEILADAVDYIHRLRAERDAALHGLESLRSTWRASAGASKEAKWQQPAAMEDSSRRGSDFDGPVFDNQLHIFE